MELTSLLRRTGQRLRVAALLAGLAAGLVAAAACVAFVGLAMQAPGAGAVLGGALVLAVALASYRRAAARWTPLTTAMFVEARAGGLDNLVVTAADLEAGSTIASPLMRAEVLRQATERITDIQPTILVPLGRTIGMALVAAAGALMLLWSALTLRQAARESEGGNPAVPVLQSVQATVTPPAYLALAARALADPDAIVLPAGSHLRLDVRASAPRAWLEDPSGQPRVLAAVGEGVFRAEWVPDATRAFVVVAGDTAGDVRQSRLLQVVVTPDRPPQVRVIDPGGDLAFGSATAIVQVAIDATDEERLDGLRVSYVRMSGSGESFAFDEGQVPVAIERVSAGHWKGRATLSLAALKLEDGDSIVYRALARDSNPGGAWVSSDAFTVDVGTRLEFAGAGFAVPDEDRRYAISQQMVIVKTERLLAERTEVQADDWAERTRMLAIEQRMVRAEVVFLSGGEVQDEVEEAAHSDELQEGRLENAGRAEMLRAINEMSRAEARLNGGDAAGALVFERAALAALQRAFDRRRYFLRTLAERSRIDQTRRLTGDLKSAQSALRPVNPGAEDALEDRRQLVRELGRIAETGNVAEPGLLARLASVDPAASDWRALASALAAASSVEERRDAARRAMARVSADARSHLGAAGARVELGDLGGWWRAEWPGGARP